MNIKNMTEKAKTFVSEHKEELILSGLAIGSYVYMKQISVDAEKRALEIGKKVNENYKRDLQDSYVAGIQEAFTDPEHANEVHDKLVGVRFDDATVTELLKGKDVAKIMEHFDSSETAEEVINELLCELTE